MHKTVIQTHEHIIHICDICKTEDGDGHYTCRICGKDMCRKCAIPISEVRMWRYDVSDYPTMYCKPCWEKGKEFRDRLDQIDAIRDAAEDVTMNEWKEKIKYD